MEFIRDNLKRYESDILELLDTHTAVIYSEPYGAGFTTTWNFGINPADRRIVDFLLNNGKIIDFCYDWGDRFPKIEVKIGENEMKSFLEDDLRLGRVFLGCLCDPLTITFLPKGTKYRLNEYDGSESIEVLNTSSWMEA